jgi:hypothetical protein
MVNAALIDKKIPEIKHEAQINALQITSMITAVALTGIFAYLATTMNARSAGFAVSITMAGVGGAAMVMTAIAMAQHSKKVLDQRRKKEERIAVEHDCEPEKVEERKKKENVKELLSQGALQAKVEEPKLQEPPAQPVEPGQPVQPVQAEPEKPVRPQILVLGALRAAVPGQVPGMAPAELRAQQERAEALKLEEAEEAAPVLAASDTPPKGPTVHTTGMKAFRADPLPTNLAERAAKAAGGVGAAVAARLNSAAIKTGEIDRKVASNIFESMIFAVAPHLELRDPIAREDTLNVQLRKLQTARVLRDKKQEGWGTTLTRTLPGVAKAAGYEDTTPKEDLMLRNLLGILLSFQVDPAAKRKSFFAHFNALYQHAVTVGDMRDCIEGKETKQYVKALLALAKAHFTAPVWKYAESAMESASGFVLETQSTTPAIPLSLLIKSIHTQMVNAPAYMVGAFKQGLKVQVGAYNPLETHNPAHALGTIEGKTQWVRSPVPTKEMLGKETEIVDIYRVFLIACRVEKKEVLVFEYQNRELPAQDALEKARAGDLKGAIKGALRSIQTEAHRLSELDQLEEDFEDVLSINNFPMDGQWFEQNGMDDESATFIRAFKDQANNEDGGIVLFGDDISVFKKMIDRVHTHLFESKISLSQEERRSFILFTYAFMQRHLIAKYQPDYMSHQCSDSVDRGGLASVMMMVTKYAQEGKLDDPKVRRDLNILAQFPALLAVGTPMAETRFNDLVKAVEYIEKNKDTMCFDKVLEGFDDIGEVEFVREVERVSPVVREPRPLCSFPLPSRAADEEEYVDSLKYVSQGFDDLTKSLQDSLQATVDKSQLKRDLDGCSEDVIKDPAALRAVMPGATGAQLAVLTQGVMADALAPLL